jgi:hypothetical protein
MASIFLSPSDGNPPAPGSVINYSVGIKWLISWMVMNGFRLPHELTPNVIAQYIEDLPRLIVDEQDDEVIGESQVTRALYILLPLWRQRRVLSKMGIEPIPQFPFLKRSPHVIAKQIATKPGGWIKPLPDEVAIPLFNKAAWFLETPASDLLQLLPNVIAARGGQTIRLKKIHYYLNNFHFRVPEGELEPWHVSFTEWSGPIFRGRIREIFEAVRDACVFLIQGTSGMRISEVLGIKAGIDPITGFPNGVQIEESITGLYEWFIIRTDLYKTQRTPLKVEWVLGMRPKGSDKIPLAVKALIILNSIYSFWQGNAKSDRLILSLQNNNALPHPNGSLDPICAQRLSDSLKRFIGRWIDLSCLPDESVHKIEDRDLVVWREQRGKNFSSHMLRKAWAQFTLAVDHRLLPAIQMQFHHLNLAMTEGGYIGRNPLLVETLNAVTRQQRNLLIYETVTGQGLLAGRMGEQIEKATQGLRDEISNLPTTEKWKRVVEFCEHSELPIFFSPHGKCCPTRTSEMRCQDEAGVPIWLREGPNFSTREPSLCSGCACFILDSKHQSFWVDRYINNWISFRQAESVGLSGQFRVVRERAEQAGKLLHKIGVDTEPLDQEISEALGVRDAKT